MFKALTATTAVYLAAALLPAHAQTASPPTTAAGCTSRGPDFCLYVQGKRGEVYHLVAWGPPTPAPGTAVIATGIVQPPPIYGFCGNRPTLFATKITPIRLPCR